MDVAESQELQGLEKEVHCFSPQRKALCVYPRVRGCVKRQFLWLTKIPVGVDKALTACVLKPKATLTFHKVFCCRHWIISISISIFREIEAPEVSLLDFAESTSEKVDGLVPSFFLGQAGTSSG